MSRQPVYFNNNKPRKVNNRRDANKLVEASYKAFLGMGLMTLLDMGLQDDFKFGADEAEKFIDKMRDLFDSYCRGYISFEDICSTIYEESGIKII